jgi:hypothetical protein
MFSLYVQLMIGKVYSAVSKQSTRKLHSVIFLQLYTFCKCIQQTKKFINKRNSYLWVKKIVVFELEIWKEIRYLQSSIA